MLLSPAVTLAFGVAVLPFSWPFLAALPIMLGIVAALSHGGVIVAWWRRLPPLRAVLWLLGSFLALIGGRARSSRTWRTAAALGVAAVTGLVNARAWYGLAGIAARVHPRTPASVPARVLFGLPFAPIAALMVLALVVGVARLMFTGTIQLPISTASPVGRQRTRIGGGTRPVAGRRPPRHRAATATAAAGARGPGRSAAGARPAATRPTACARRCRA